MRFHNLQVLRLAAAAGVAALHLGTYAPAEFGVPDGSVGWLRLSWVGPFLVPAFFAVSGFVLTHALRAASPGRFALDRAVRLYPGYWAAVGVVAGAYAAGWWPGAYLSFADPAPTAETFLLTPPTRFRLGQYPLLVEWTLIYEVVLSAGLVGMRVAVGRRGVPAAAVAWLAAVAVKSVARPDLGSRPIPSWAGVWVSVFVAPFLLGVLAYHLKDRGRRWRWPVLAAVVGLNAAAAGLVPEARVDAHYWLRGLAAGLFVWFLVQVRDVAAGNPLAVGGGYSYGLYLLHVPLILFAFRAMQAAGVLAGTGAGVAVAGVVALAGGLAAGRAEQALHRRLKRLTGPDAVRAVRAALGRLRLRVRVGVSAGTGTRGC